MKKWIVVLRAEGQTLAEEKIQSHLPGRLTFATIIFYSNDAAQVHRKCTGGYKFTKSQERIIILSTLKTGIFFIKNENKLSSLIQTIRIYNQDIWMEFKYRTTKSRKHQNVRREWKILLLENIESRHHRTNGNEKIQKRVP